MKFKYYYIGIYIIFLTESKNKYIIISNFQNLSLYLNFIFMDNKNLS